MGDVSQAPESGDDLVLVSLYMPRKLRDQIQDYKKSRGGYRRTTFQEIVALALGAYLKRRHPPDREAA